MARIASAQWAAQQLCITTPETPTCERKGYLSFLQHQDPASRFWSHDYQKPSTAIYPWCYLRDQDRAYAFDYTISQLGRSTFSTQLLRWFYHQKSARFIQSLSGCCYLSKATSFREVTGADAQILGNIHIYILQCKHRDLAIYTETWKCTPDTW